MDDSVLLGRGRQLLRLPREMWEQHLAHVPEHSGERLRFMTDEHHRVRYFVVRELPLAGKPIAPEEISAALHMPLARVEAILEELERQLFFLVRSQQGAVVWAYPVTVEPTPHQMRFSSGEWLYAA